MAGSGRRGGGEGSWRGWGGEGEVRGWGGEGEVRGHGGGRGGEGEVRGHGGGRGGEGEVRGHGPVECVVVSYGRRGWDRWLGSGVAAATHHHVVCTVHEWYAVCPSHPLHSPSLILCHLSIP